LLLGNRITARQALDWGLINRVVPKGKALEEALKMAQQLCENGPLSIKGITRSLRELDESMPFAEAQLQGALIWTINERSFTIVASTPRPAGGSAPRPTPSGSSGHSGMGRGKERARDE
jgi:enoyl-CoA hydratase/carnithine racemase